MGFTGGGFTFIVCLSFMVAVYDAAHIKTEGHLNRMRVKREISKVKCQNSKLSINPTKEATYIKIVTESGDTLFNVDTTNTNMGDIYDLLTRSIMLLFPKPGNYSFGKSSDFFIMKSPFGDGVTVALVDKSDNTVFVKHIKRNRNERKGFNIQCAHLNGAEVVAHASLDVNHRDGYNMTALVWASLLGERDLAKTLVEKGADVNSAASNGSTPLVGAISSGDEELVEFLIKHGAKISEPINSFYMPTPLHIAAYKGRVGVARTLLTHGANISSLEKQGWAPIHYAVREGQLDMVKELVAKGADLNARAHGNGWTPLHMATSIGDEDLINYLLQSGADINARTTDNSTPLMIAVSHRGKDDESLKIVKHLIEDHNSDVNAKNNKGQTALSLASSKEFSKVQDFLKATGAV